MPATDSGPRRFQDTLSRFSDGSPPRPAPMGTRPKLLTLPMALDDRSSSASGGAAPRRSARTSLTESLDGEEVDAHLAQVERVEALGFRRVAEDLDDAARADVVPAQVDAVDGHVVGRRAQTAAEGERVLVEEALRGDGDVPPPLAVDARRPVEEVEHLLLDDREVLDGSFPLHGLLPRARPVRDAELLPPAARGVLGLLARPARRSP
mmetsp:Transcript_9881/g.34030  ORF Transcript_9881/g.34030 Transcript_9881/m.34030 type:complete len:208 (+) Transcript_9881:220-843(+)